MSQPKAPRCAGEIAARITHTAAALCSVLNSREQPTAAGDSGHDHGLHIFARRLLVGVGEHVAPGQAPTADGVAQLVLDAEPLREALAFREDANARRRQTDWELHSLAYMLLTSLDLLSTRYPEVDAHVDAAIRERQRAKPFSESVAAVLADWPVEQRARLADELADQGYELPPDVVDALRTVPDA
ncbi:hypothetical protein [Streptomyces sp. NBC_00582]|uniref:hypothetical protein n=1 Tax=Streptomyces sp. NBC_00582 TaxID=2975783 RepID=UPI002E805DAB|nr:hypothetical protein [Streptomyces sp. NBC_00582]WUB68461.1 hypothetical protein OG852_50055 [Streptomyces sp. NBC_00582]